MIFKKIKVQDRKTALATHPGRPAYKLRLSFSKV